MTVSLEFPYFYLLLSSVLRALSFLGLLCIVPIMSLLKISSQFDHAHAHALKNLITKAFLRAIT